MKLAKRDKISLILIALSVVIIVTTILIKSNVFMRSVNFNKDNEELVVKEPEFLYGICIDSLNVVSSTVKQGETLSNILDKQGLSAIQIDEIVRKSQNVFDLRNFREGNTYSVLTTMDSLQRAKYVIYEHSVREYVVFSLLDSISVKKQEKEVEVRRRMGSAVIESSLWNAAVAAGMNGTLAMNLSDVFQWTIDFYAVQPGDAFKVIYDELYIDGKSVGVGTIWGAWFKHSGKSYYAVRHEYAEAGVKERGYWDETGKSLKSAFLKAPLKFSRISSKFSNARLHPVLRIRRPHHGVDYAAPSGTPVQAIANGVVTHKYFERGGGNVLKIKHAHGYVSGYLHLKGYAKNIRVGSSVKQGDLIGYVGSTGMSTGPHLDFRIWSNGKAIDPLKISSNKGEDITKSQRAAFEQVRNIIIGELDGKMDKSEVDSLQNDIAKRKASMATVE